MFISVRSLGSCRMFCNIAQAEVATLNFRYNVRPRKKKLAALLQEIFDCSSWEAYETIQEHPFLQNLSQNHIKDAASILKKCQIKGKELRRCPIVLSILPITIEHHVRVLKESGFSKVTLPVVWRYMYVVRKKISLLKAHGFLPEDANVSKNFLTILKAPENVVQSVESRVDINSDHNNVFNLLCAVLKSYLEWRLDATREEVEHLFSTYVRLRNKSLQLMDTTLSILLDDLHFPKEYVIKNGFIIQAHPEHLRKILENVPYLGEKPIRDVLYACPSMISASFENFMEILKELKKAGVPEENIVRAGNIFHLTGQRVKERLPKLDPRKMSPEVKDFMNDKKLLEVLLKYGNFMQRVTFLSNQFQSSSLPLVPSSNRLLSSHKSFEEFMKGVSGSVRGNDVLYYLVKSFKDSTDYSLNVSAEDLRTLLKKNPHWRHVPLSEVRACFEMLLEKHYEPKEILSTLPIVLYPSRIVEQRLKYLSSQPEVLECFQLDSLVGNDFLDKGRRKSKSRARQDDVKSGKRRAALIREHALSLCLYFLEKDYHFSGDGIWFRE